MLKQNPILESNFRKIYQKKYNFVKLKAQV